MPDVGIQVPPNLSDWWVELVRAGATDLGGLSANGDHISPEHPFPSPAQVRKRLHDDGLALTERLCVYPEYIDPEWIAQPVLDVIKSRYWSFIPRRGSGRRAELSVADDVAPRAVARAREGRADARGADRAVRRAAPGGDRGDARAPPTSCAPSWPARPSRSSSTATSTSPTSASSAARSAGSGSRGARPTPTSTPRRSSRSRVAGGGRRRRDRDLHAVGDPSRLGARGLREVAAVRQAARAAAAPARVLADGGRAHVRRQRPVAAAGVRPPARGRARARRPGPRPRCCTTACASGSRPTSCRSRAGSRSSRPRHAEGIRSTVTVMFGHIEEPWELAEHMRVVRELQERTGGFTEFVPLSFIPFHTLLGRTHGRRGDLARGEPQAHRRVPARARAGPSPTSRRAGSRWGWTPPPRRCDWGVNDLGGTLMEESISRMAGSYHGVRLEPRGPDRRRPPSRPPGGRAHDAVRDPPPVRAAGGGDVSASRARRPRCSPASSRSRCSSSCSPTSTPTPPRPSSTTGSARRSAG